MSATEAKIQFLNFFVNESHIIFKEAGQFKIAIEFAPKGLILKSLNQFNLELKVNIKDENGKFEINLITLSVFEYSKDADLEKFKDSYFTSNAPAIVFPYLRAYIASLTALSGMPTLNLPTLNLSTIGDALKGNIVEVEE